MVLDYAAAKAGLYGLARTSFPARDTGAKEGQKSGRNLGTWLTINTQFVKKGQSKGHKAFGSVFPSYLARKIKTGGFSWRFAKAKQKAIIITIKGSFLFPNF